MTLKELLARAAPLPWHSNNHGHIQTGAGRTIAAVNLLSGPLQEADAVGDLITHAVNVLPETLKALERIRDIQVNVNSEPDTMTPPWFQNIERIVLGALVTINSIEGK